VIILNIVTQFAEAASHAAEEPQGIAALGIDPWALLAQGVTFLVLVWVLKKFAFTKIVDILEQRRIAVEESLDKADELSKKNEQAEKRVNALLHEARQESEGIIARSHEEAGAIVQQAEDAAGAKAEKIIKDGEARIEAEVGRARQELKKEMLSLVSQATSTVLDEAVDNKKNEALIKKALKESK
jgi:F-type H+-transporting ATPase subunit b